MSKSNFTQVCDRKDFTETPLPLAMRAVISRVGKPEHGRLTLALPGGRLTTLDGKETGPSASIRVLNPRIARRLILGGGVALAEGYMDGDWETPDLLAVMQFAASNRNLARSFQGASIVQFVSRLRHSAHRNHRAGSRRNIAAHYDLGNDFYGAWLDSSMTYSSALFDAADQSLAAAQKAKYQRLCTLLNLKPGEHLLEIGCGWGGFAIHAARERAARVTAVTLSKEQFEFAWRRVQQEDLAELIDVRLCDYRDLEGKFDKIASIEMFEAVGEAYWPLYLNRLKHHLAPEGRAVMQIITIADELFDGYRRNPDFIQRYIFPGGMLPAPRILTDLFAMNALRVTTNNAIGSHYALTLAHWRNRFLEAWPELAQQGFDLRFKRMWEYYLAYCEAGFRNARIGACQIVLTHDD